jgi:hypothetical protein
VTALFLPRRQLLLLWWEPLRRVDLAIEEGTRMRALLRLWFLALAPLLGSNVGCQAGDSRIIAFGDVHGDINATREALRLAGAIDQEDRWIGGTLIVVQTGDQLDRGDDEQAILDLFDKLRIEAVRSGGAFFALLGNHELMNAKADLRYVTEQGFVDFEDAVDYDPSAPKLAAFEPNQRARMAALLPGGPYAQMLGQRSLIMQLDDNLFVHGGVLPHHVDYGIERINTETRAWLQGEAEMPEILKGSDSPQWTRLYSDEPDSMACATLRETLDQLGAKRIIVGHTVQEEGITSHCSGSVWCIDVGMAAHYGGDVEVLEIVGDHVRVLKRE